MSLDVAIEEAECGLAEGGIPIGAMLVRATLSPCAMRSGAILLYGIPHVIVGENRPFMGEEELLRARGVRVDVVQDERCIRLMRDFIAAHPGLWHEDIGE